MHYVSSEAARQAGNFSRRHRTSDARDASRQRRKARQAEKLNSAKARQLEASTRSAKAQLKLLDERLGPGQGATKERARLKALINATAKPSKKGKRAA